MKEVIQGLLKFLDEGEHRGHLPQCEAVHGPDFETWLVETDCSCGLTAMRKLAEAALLLPENNT